MAGSFLHRPCLQLQQLAGQWWHLNSDKVFKLHKTQSWLSNQRLERWRTKWRDLLQPFSSTWLLNMVRCIDRNCHQVNPMMKKVQILILQAAHCHRTESPTPTQLNVVMPVSLKCAYNMVVPSSETKNAKGKFLPKLYIVPWRGILLLLNRNNRFLSYLFS